MEQEQARGLGRRGRLGGRAAAGPLLLVVPSLALAAATLLLLRPPGERPHDGYPGRPSDARAVRTPGEVAGLGGTLVLDEAVGVGGALGLGGTDGERLVARLTPLQPAPAWQAFDAAALRARLGLPDGEPWRLELVRAGGDGAAGPLSLGEVAVVDAAGTALVPLGDVAPAPPGGGAAPADPVARLYRARPTALPPGGRGTLVLWGRRPGADARLRVAGAAVALDPEAFPAELLPRSLARLDGAAAEEEGR